MKRGRRAVLILAGLAAIILVSALLGGWRDLVLHARRLQAGRECLDPEMKHPIPGWKALLDAGEAGFPHVAALLDDPDPRVWEGAVRVLDLAIVLRIEMRPPKSPLLRHLLERQPRAGLRYLFWGSQVPESLEREDFTAGGKALQATRETVLQCEEALWGGCAPRVFRDLRWELREVHYKAVEALAAMIEDGAVGQPIAPARDPQGLQARTIELVAAAAAAAQAERFCENGLHFIQLLAHRTPHGPGASIPEEAWLAFALGDPDVAPEEEEFLHPSEVLALLHNDEALTLHVLARRGDLLASRPELHEILFDECGGFPMPRPRWFPLIDAARRLLACPEDRPWAAVALAHADLPGGCDLLREALAAEKNPETALFLRAALFALGDDAHLSELLDALEVEGGTRVSLELCLALRGDRDVLDRVIQARIAGGYRLYFLERVIDGYPTFQGCIKSEYVTQAIVQWWATHRATIAWDPAARRWRS